MLAAVGVVLRELRASDFAGRYGGEEFILLLPDADRDGCAVSPRELRVRRLAARGRGRLATDHREFRSRLDPGDATEPTLLLRTADRALYLAKAHGRNRVETLSSTDPEPVGLALA